MTDSPERKSSDQEADAGSELDLKRFEATPDDHGLSLDELSQTFAQLIGRGEDPYAGDVNPPAETDEPRDAAEVLDASDDERLGEVSPHGILEAMLFVGHPQNVPLGSAQVAALMRGVRAEEIHDIVKELNETYDELGCPFEIKAEGDGYRMDLRGRYASLRNKFYGKIREARLSQAAIDVLAIVAYHQPINREEVDRLRGRPTGGLLRQLVRRELLRIERRGEKPRITYYHTTDRFLELFAMDSLDDLPQSQELDRSF